MAEFCVGKEVILFNAGLYNMQFNFHSVKNYRICSYSVSGFSDFAYTRASRIAIIAILKEAEDNPEKTGDDVRYKFHNTTDNPCNGIKHCLEKVI
ncbi:MAG: hypothetical protein J5905_05330 [Prevotella sp.]|nr:hypothetical protein [Prevotella sp.]